MKNLLICAYHTSSTSFNGLPLTTYATTGDLTNLDPVSFPPALAVPKADRTEIVPDAEGIVSLEIMLFRRKLEYDFDVASGKDVVGGQKGGRNSFTAVRKVKLNLKGSFDQLLSDPGNFRLKLRFYVIRLKLGTLLVERLLWDFIKRCKLHLRMLSKEEKSPYYVKRSHLLIREIARFNVKKGRVF